MPQTDTYTNLVTQVEALFGASLTTAELARLKVLANQRAYRIYRAFDYWPETMIMNDLRTLGPGDTIPAEIVAARRNDGGGGVGTERAMNIPIDTLFYATKEKAFQRKSVREYEFTHTSIEGALRRNDGKPTEGWKLHDAGDAAFLDTYYIYQIPTSSWSLVGSDTDIDAVLRNNDSGDSVPDSSNPSHPTEDDAEGMTLTCFVRKPVTDAGYTNPAANFTTDLSSPTYLPIDYEWEKDIPNNGVSAYGGQEAFSCLIPFGSEVKIDGLVGYDLTLSNPGLRFPSLDGAEGRWGIEPLWGMPVGYTAQGGPSSNGRLFLPRSYSPDWNEGAPVDENLNGLYAVESNADDTALDAVTAEAALWSSATIKAKAVFCTYKRRLTETFGDGSGEETDIPKRWFNYIAQGTYADLLRADGQNEKALAEDAFAKTMLDEEVHRLETHGKGRPMAMKVRTNVSRQHRNR